MQADHPISLLIWMTFAAVILIVGFLLVRHLRKPGNRHPMDGQPERTGEEISRDGAGD